MIAPSDARRGKKNIPILYTYLLYIIFVMIISFDVTMSYTTIFGHSPRGYTSLRATAFRHIFLFFFFFSYKNRNNNITIILLDRYPYILLYIEYRSFVSSRNRFFFFRFCPALHDLNK